MSDSIKNNPWIGLSQYPDPEESVRPYQFCGRERESRDIFGLIDDNICVTIYGKSGIGKSSILKAGVFPLLRENRYLPISVRLWMDARDTTFQECIIKALETAIEKKGHIEQNDIIPPSSDNNEEDYFWRYFARTSFKSSEGKTLFPVIVLDQFEEVLRERGDDAEVLLRQIDFLADTSHALVCSGSGDEYDYNYRFVTVLREDDLYRLEDTIDNNYLPKLKQGRYRLRHLTDKGAREVILTPGKDLFKEEDKDAIVETILELSKAENEGVVSSQILSLVCNRMFSAYQLRGEDFITLSLVESFANDNPLRTAYFEIISRLPFRERKYLERHLVDSAGRRNFVSFNEFKENVPSGMYLLNGDTQILVQTTISSHSGDSCVEFIHDSFCDVLRWENERERQSSKKASLIIVLIVTAIMLPFVILYIINNFVY